MRANPFHLKSYAMQDEILNKLITIRATGEAVVKVHPDSTMSKHNGKTYPVDDVRVNGDKAQVSLNIHGVITDFTQDEVEPA